VAAAPRVASPISKSLAGISHTQSLRTGSSLHIPCIMRSMSAAHFDVQPADSADCSAAAAAPALFGATDISDPVDALLAPQDRASHPVPSATSNPQGALEAASSAMLHIPTAGMHPTCNSGYLSAPNSYVPSRCCSFSIPASSCSRRPAWPSFTKKGE
jgi:hypothetical protein